MKNFKLLLFIPALILILFSASCDSNNGGNNAAAQPAPMSGTDATGTVNAPSAQTCPENVMIEGFKAQDVVILEIDSTGDMTGEATITNTTSSTSAKCSGMIDAPLPAEVASCKVSSSNIAGLAVNDNLDISVAFSSQVKEFQLANLSGPMGLECAIMSLETLNVN